MKCKQCNNEYEAKRSTSLYCSPKCKQEFYRNRMSEPVTLSEGCYATPVTLTQGEDVVQGGECWCCGKEIASILVCCGECAWSGKAKQQRAGRQPPVIGQPVFIEAGP